MEENKEYKISFTDKYILNPFAFAVAMFFYAPLWVLYQLKRIFKKESK